MEASTARRLAHGMWFGTLAIWLGALILELATSPSDAIPTALLGLPIATYGSVGALVARRTPRNPIGWLFSAVGLAIAIWLFGLVYAAIGLDPGAGIGDLPGAAVAAWAGVVSLIGVLPIALPLFLLYFPDGTPAIASMAPRPVGRAARRRPAGRRHDRTLVGLRPDLPVPTGVDQAPTRHRAGLVAGRRRS